MFVFVILTFLVSAAFGMVIIPQILKFCKMKGIYDMPDTRKVHKRAIPRLGGVAFLPCVFLGCLLSLLITHYNGIRMMSINIWTIYFVAGMSAIYFTGLVDDLVGLRPLTKLIIQLAAASTLPLSYLYINNLQGFCGIYEISPLIGIPLTLIAIAFVSNAINLIDGIDGLSGGLSLIMFGGLLYAFYQWQLWVYVLIISGMMGVITAFLYFNIFGNPEKGTKIFMGDTGSLSLGFMIAFMCLKLSCSPTHIDNYYHGNGLFLSITLLAVPVFDVFRISFLRMFNGRSPVEPDKNHIHHKLLRYGFSQHQTLLIILSFALIIIGMNVALHSLLGMTLTIFLDVFVYTLFHFVLNCAMKKKGVKPNVFQ